jgi:hypothetical protein
MAVGLHRREGGPLSRCKDARTGHRWIGTASHRAGVETPRHDHVKRQGVQSPLLRLHAQLRNLPPWLQHAAKQFYFPPTAIPLHHRARTEKLCHEETRQPQPLNRGFVLGWPGLLGLDCPDLYGRQFAARATRPLAGHLRSRHREGDLAGWPSRGAGQCKRAVPQGRRRPLGPAIPLRRTRGEAPLTLGADAHLCPLLRLSGPRVHPPLLAVACTLGQVHAQSGRRGLLDLTGGSLPGQPTVTLFCFTGWAFALRGAWLLRPLPALPPHHPSLDARRRQSHRAME